MGVSEFPLKFLENLFPLPHSFKKDLEMGVSEKLHWMDSESWLIAGIKLKSIFTTTQKNIDDQNEGDCSTTPTSSESRIPTTISCPRPPKKPKPAASARCGRGITEFFNPSELEMIFICRVEGSQLNY